MGQRMDINSNAIAPDRLFHGSTLYAELILRTRPRFSSTSIITGPPGCWGANSFLDTT